MLISHFKENGKSRKRKNLEDAAKIAGGSYLAVQGTRSGIPRALGIRLESHSTGKRQAKQILKGEGFLDPNKYGEQAASALKALGLDERDAASKGKVYITGMHPDEVAKYRNKPVTSLDDLRTKLRKQLANSPLAQRSHVQTQRTSYRTQGSLSAEELASQTRIKKKLLSNTPLDANDSKELLKLTGKSLASPLTGKSLYVGGSDDFFRKNFVPDVDDVAMASSKKVKVAANRLGAINQAIKREGLGNLIKKAPKSRLAAGVGLLGVAGLGAGLAAKSVNNVKRRYTKKDLNYWKNKIKGK